MKGKAFFCSLLLFLVLLGNIVSSQIPPTISYQGVLTDAEGNPRDGTFALAFKLYEAAAGGSPLWEETQQVQVKNGLFNVILGKTNPLELPFDTPYWLGITVDSGTELQPRIQLAAVPYSLNARSVADSSVSTTKIQNGAVTQAKLAPGVTLPPGGQAGGDLTGTYPNPSIANQAVTSAKIASGQVVKSLNALTDAVFLKGGNGATISTRGDTIVITAGGSAGNAWSLTGNSGTTPANFLGTTDESPLELRVNNERGLLLQPNGSSVSLIGGNENSVTTGVLAATVVGGASNRVTDNSGTVGGGFLNQAGNDNESTSDREAATVSGGRENIASGAYAAIGGGANNKASAAFATIAGGGNSSTPQEGNRVTDAYGAVGGGTNNQAGDGSGTPDDAAYATVSGGSENLASGFYSAVGGGQGNTASGRFATVAGGTNNIASGDFSTVIGGGSDHYAIPSVASGKFATVAGGKRNRAAGNYSFAAGRRAKANHTGAFVWADSSQSDFASTAPNQFLIRAGGGVGIGTNQPGEMLTVAGTIESTTGGFKFPDGTVQTTAATSGSPGWGLSGNAGTNPNDNFVGTTDQAPLQFRVNNQTALRLTPNNFGPNLLGGSGSNTVAAGVNSATIAGGGQEGFANRVMDNFGTVGGGGHNIAGSDDNDLSSAMYATVSGGANNEASGPASTIGGGLGNTANNKNSTIAGGSDNNASGENAAIGGGDANTASGKGSTVAGGSGNDANALYATIGGGWNNVAHAAYATIAGGGRLDVNDPATGNRVTDHYGTVGGGGGNQAGDGDSDPNYAMFATVGGGGNNLAGKGWSTVAGGANNQATAKFATVSGGSDNKARGYAASVPGGYLNSAGGDYSLAAGLRAKADHKGSFVWADAQDTDFSSTADNQFLIRAAGGVGIGTNSPQGMLHVAGGDIVLGDDNVQNTNRRSVYLAGHVYLTPWGTSDVAYLQARRGDNTGSTELQIRTTQNGFTHDVIRIDRYGYVGIGTTKPMAKLHIYNDDLYTPFIVDAVGNLKSGIAFARDRQKKWRLYLYPHQDKSNDFRIAEANSSTPSITFQSGTTRVGIGKGDPQYALDVAGSVAGEGPYINLSDRRYKKNVHTLSHALDKVLQLRGVNFQWKKDEYPDLNLNDRKQIGFIAQEVQQVLPEVVYQSDKVGYSVAYGQVVPVLVEAIKEQQEIIDKQQVALEQQRAENAAIRAELNDLKSKMSDLTAQMAALQEAVQGFALGVR